MNPADQAAMSMRNPARFADYLTRGWSQWYYPGPAVRMAVPVSATQYAGAGPDYTMGSSCQRAGSQLATYRHNPMKVGFGKASQAGDRLARCRWGPRRAMSGTPRTTMGFLGDLVGGVVSWVSGADAKAERIARDQARTEREVAQTNLQIALTQADTAREQGQLALQAERVKYEGLQRLVLVGGGIALAAGLVVMMAKRR